MSKKGEIRERECGKWNNNRGYACGYREYRSPRAALSLSSGGNPDNCVRHSGIGDHGVFAPIVMSMIRFIVAINIDGATAGGRECSNTSLARSLRSRFRCSISLSLSARPCEMHQYPQHDGIDPLSRGEGKERGFIKR